MSILRGVASSFSLFGPYGVALVAKARLLQRPMEVSVSISGIEHPFHVRLRTTDVSLVSEMLQNAEFDLDLSAPPRVIVDVGANSGITSVYYANKYPQARVLAIEPELSNYEILEKNAAPYANIACVRAALWKNDKTLTIADPGLGHWGFQAVEDSKAGRASSSDVEGITVNTLMTRFGIDYIDFLRIDIEGAEQEVFEDASLWIDRVGVIAIELHDRLKSGCSRSFYLATADFEWELRRGETVFLGRRGFAVREVVQSDASMDSASASPYRSRRRTCTIVSAT